MSAWLCVSVRACGYSRKPCLFQLIFNTFLIFSWFLVGVFVASGKIRPWQERWSVSLIMKNPLWSHNRYSQGNNLKKIGKFRKSLHYQVYTFCVGALKLALELVFLQRGPVQQDKKWSECRMAWKQKQCVWIYHISILEFQCFVEVEGIPELLSVPTSISLCQTSFWQDQSENWTEMSVDT